MTRLLQDKLLAATVRTFEGLAFMFVAKPYEEEEIPPSFEAAVRVSFHGAVDGTLYLISHRDVLGPLTANMLGEKAAAQPTIAIDALGEAANVICGNFLSCIEDQGRCFSLDAPAQISTHQVEVARKEATANLIVGVDEGRAEVILTLASIPAELKEIRS